MPDIQYPILYWSFHEGPNEAVGSKGIAAFRHRADPAVTVGDGPIYGASAQNPDR